MNSLSRYTIGYFAGIIDGEGWIGLPCGKRGNFNPSIAVEMTDHNIICSLHHWTGIGSIRYNSEHKKNAGGKRRKMTASWSVTKRADIRDFLIVVRPFLRIKSEQADVMLDFINNAPPRSHRRLPVEEQGRRKFLHERMKILNARGRPIEESVDAT